MYSFTRDFELCQEHSVSRKTVVLSRFITKCAPTKVHLLYFLEFKVSRRTAGITCFKMLFSTIDTVTARICD
jgi:hypothetical protein